MQTKANSFGNHRAVSYGVNSTIELTHSEFSAHKIVFTLPKLKTSAKSVQTTRVVCANYG